MTGSFRFHGWRVIAVCVSQRDRRSDFVRRVQQKMVFLPAAYGDN